MTKTAVNQFDTVPGNNTDVNGVGVGASMTVDNVNDAMQHLMALIAQQMGEVGAMSADIASAATTSLSTARGWFANITGTNTISSFGTGVPAGKMFRLRMVNGLTLTYNAVSMILPNAVSLAVGAGDIVTMLSLGSGNWRMIDSSPASGYAVPAGSIIDFGGTTAPGGWLLCYGQAVSRTGYPLLYAAIGTTYGVGDGSTTFNVPDLRGRVSAGQDDMGGTSANRLTGLSGGVDGDVLGSSGGLETHTLTTAQLAVHTHTATTTDTAHSHTFSDVSGGVSADHVHSYVYPTSFNQVEAGTPGPANVWAGTQTVNTGLMSGNHTHTIGGTTSSVNLTITTTNANAGSGTAHNNVQPTTILNKIIKT